MKFGKLLKKMNQDVLMGIVIGIMLVILACFMGFCYSPKKTLLEGMENDSSSSSNSSSSKPSSSSTAYYNTVIGSMNSGCSVHNTQKSCNSNFYMLNNKKHSCEWNTINQSCGFSNKDFTLKDFDGWTKTKASSLSPSSSSNSSSSNSSSSNSSSN